MRERRSFHRMDQVVEGRYRVSGHFSALGSAMTLLNFSAGGARFRSQEQLEKNTLLEIEVKISGLRDALHVKGYVVWSTLRASGVAETGVEFLDVSPDQQYQIDSIVQFFRSTMPKPLPPIPPAA